MLALDPKREKYPSRIADVSRVNSQKGPEVYLGVRIPDTQRADAERRFSILLPGSVGRSERAHFEDQWWARYFEDDRDGVESTGQRGYFLPWTSAARGTENLFRHLWLSIEGLPLELQELHHDGRFCRALFRGSPQRMAGIDVAAVKQSLQEMCRRIAPLPVGTVRDSWFRAQLRGAGALALFILLVGIFWFVAPTVRLVNQDEVIGMVVTVGLLMIFLVRFFLRRSVNWNSWSCTLFMTLLGLIAAISSYARLQYSVRDAGWEEQWKVLRIEDVKQKYTKKTTAHRLVVAPIGGGAQMKLPLSLENRRACAVDVGETVTVHLFADIFGLRFVDAVQGRCKLENDGRPLTTALFG